MRLARTSLPFAVVLVMAAVGSSSAADVKIGEQLAYTCSGCHGIAEYKNAYPQYHVPKIAGQNYAYLVAALKGYKDGSRSHPTMRAQASSFSDSDIENLASYISQTKEVKK